MSAVLGQLALFGGAATFLLTTAWHRHNFSTVTLPRRRFVQNAIIEEDLELFEQEIISSVRSRMTESAQEDVKATAVLDKFEICGALEKLAMAIDMDVDLDLLVRYKHLVKYVICLRIRDCLSAPVDRPRSYLPFDSVLTYRSRQWLEMASTMELQLDQDYVSPQSSFLDPSLTVVGNSAERAYIEALYRKEGKKGIRLLMSRHRWIAMSMCWGLLMGGRLTPGRRREASRNRIVRLLVGGAVTVGALQLFLSDNASMIQLIAATDFSGESPVKQLAAKLKQSFVVNAVRLLVHPLHERLVSKLKRMLHQELSYIFAISLVNTDQAFCDQPSFDHHCSLDEGDRVVRGAVFQVVSSIRLASSIAYIAGLAAYSLYHEEVPLLFIGCLGGYVFSYENLCSFWKRVVLGSNSVMEKCGIDVSTVDERALPVQKPLFGLCLLGNVLATEHAAGDEREAHGLRVTREKEKHWTQISLVIIASASDWHDCMGLPAAWRSWANHVAAHIKRQERSPSRPGSSILMTSCVKNFRFLLGCVLPSWTPAANLSSLTSDVNLERQYLDSDECLMLRRSAKFIRVEDPHEFFGYEMSKFLMLRSLGVEVVHVFKSLREKRVLYESRLKKETMDSATDPDKGGFSVLLDELTHIGMMLLLHMSLQQSGVVLFSLSRLLRCRPGTTSIEALTKLSMYQSAVITLAHRCDTNFPRLIELYEIQAEAPKDMLNLPLDALRDGKSDKPALFSSEWRELLQQERPELIFDLKNRICGGFVLKDAIKFENVFFSYPTTVATKTLNGLTFSIPALSFTGIVGKTGSGKSTVLKLLKRLYDPFVVPQLRMKEEERGNVDEDSPPRSMCGRVTFDGIPISCFTTSYLRSLIATVEQKPELFNDMTILENIAFFRKVTKDEVIVAAKRAQCHNFIMSLPMQYDTLVSRDFSGGEMQRIAIARALVVAPIVLFLDEATSSLDAINEKRVQATIDDIAEKHGTTVVAIAHRLSTLKKANHLVVLMKGQCVQEGSHEELIAMPDQAVLHGKNMYRIYMQGQALGSGGAVENRRKAKRTPVPRSILDAVIQKLEKGEGRAEELVFCLRSSAESPAPDESTQLETPEELLCNEVDEETSTDESDDYEEDLDDDGGDQD